MAYVFVMTVDCGTREAARTLACHFKDYAVTLADGSAYPCGAHVLKDKEAWWVDICPDGVSRSGIQSDEDLREMTQVGFGMYERLRSAPPFRTAIVGVEAFQIRRYEDIVGDPDDILALNFTGLVVMETMWEQMGKPAVFVPFVPGYRWWPFVEAS